MNPRELTRQRADDGMCEVCGIRPATNMHHRKNRSQGGRDTAANLLAVCGTGTTGCHGYITEHPAEAYDKGWSVRRAFDPADVPVYRVGEWVVLTESGTVFVPPRGRDRCVRCGFHMPTCGHRGGCQVGVAQLTNDRNSGTVTAARTYGRNTGTHRKGAR